MRTVPGPMTLPLLGLLLAALVVSGFPMAFGPGPEATPSSSQNSTHSVVVITPRGHATSGGAHPSSSSLTPASHETSSKCQVVNVSGGVAIGTPLGTSCLWTVQTLAWQGFGTTGISIVGTLDLEGPGTVYVESGVPFVVLGTLIVSEGGHLVFNASNSVSDLGNFEVLADSSLLFNGSTFEMENGNFEVNQATVLGSGNLTAPLEGTVSKLNVQGGMGPGGSLTFQGSSIDWLNLSQSNYSLSISGSYSTPVTVDHVNVTASLSTFSADDAILSDVKLGSADNVTLGDPLASTSDSIVVQSLSLRAPLLGVLTIAHGQIQTFQWSGGATANLLSSSFGASASSITDVAKSWSATSGCAFSFPLVFNGSVVVRLVNATAPSMTLNGRVHASIYNWNGNTTFVGATGVAEVASITVTNQSAFAQIYRYLVVDVLGSTGNLPPPSTVLGITAISVPGAPTTYERLPANSSILAIFLPTDNLSAGGDTFTGRYTIAATAPGLSANSSVEVLADGKMITLQLQPPGVLSEFSFYTLILELGLLVAIVVATGYLANRIRKERPKSRSSGKDEEPQTDSHPS